jgi:heme exporter protein A
MLPSTLLRVSSLNFNYDEIKILHDISFELSAGEVLHLQGPNGVGKSTLLAILAGLLRAQSGEVSWQHPRQQHERSRFFSYLAAEANGLYLQMNAWHNLRFWHRLGSPQQTKGAEEQFLHETLARWGLRDFHLQRGLAVGFLSTGMRRRLAMARLSVSASPCWLLDEPFYGLDTKGVRLFREMLASHCANGGCAIVVSHDLSSLEGIKLRSFSLQERLGEGVNE